MNTILDNHITDISNEIESLLAPLDETTQLTVINLISYTQYPIDGHNDLVQIISQLVSCVSAHANPVSDNPIAIAALTVSNIWKIIHGHAQAYAKQCRINIEDAVLTLTAYILDDLQLHHQMAS